MPQDDIAPFQPDTDIDCSLHDGSVHIKVVTPHGDPVELNGVELRALAARLLRLADILDGSNE